MPPRERSLAPPQKGYGSLSLNSVPITTVEAVQQAAAKAGISTRAWVLRAIERQLEAVKPPKKEK